MTLEHVHGDGSMPQYENIHYYNGNTRFVCSVHSRMPQVSECTHQCGIGGSFVHSPKNNVFILGNGGHFPFFHQFRIRRVFGTTFHYILLFAPIEFPV